MTHLDQLLHACLFSINTPPSPPLPLPPSSFSFCRPPPLPPRSVIDWNAVTVPHATPHYCPLFCVCVFFSSFFLQCGPGLQLCNFNRRERQSSGREELRTSQRGSSLAASRGEKRQLFFFSFLFFLLRFLRERLGSGRQLQSFSLELELTQADCG